MNRFYNLWITIVCILTLPVALSVGLNEDFTILGFTIEGEEFAYGEIVFAASAGLLLILGGLKAVRKWMGLRLIAQKDKFSFITPISDKRKKRVALYSGLEVVFLIFWSIVFYLMANAAWPLVVALLFLALEHTLNVFIGLKLNKYGIGITNKALLRVDREVDVLYFSGLQKISFQQQNIFFEYINDLALFIPLDAIPEDKKTEFDLILKEKINPERVYYSGLEISDNTK